MLPTQNLSLMKYTNGYLPKIAYHIVVTQNQDKVDYFADRHRDEYGSVLTQENLAFLKAECERITPSPLREYLFSFEDGGWNSVYATTKEEAVETALEEYKHSALLNPIPSSFFPKEGNEETYQTLLNMFY